ncbi:sodium:proton antiporter [Shewanella sp. D64]|uniref:cation:proton antiporter n=1 Tax=unclassified Shewanella TaxID=196818 RepID=UPI0022BA1747|nr:MULTISPECIES: sodium:proton antiporter [unclassified Shewanella]MEC4724453.1 sodium:proton antiporter [Shewanella sp. D64]MEC4736770.1 sodium:proton antiporter [Shewanella sp. E94]WBJ94565.1 sodium:proton antiporter [Shewanella sp. MTB7]
MQTTLLLLVFFVVAILLGIMLRRLLKNTAIPYSVALLTLGMLIGGSLSFETQTPVINELKQSFVLASQLDANLIMFIFLPALVFESAFSLEVHLFKRMFSQIAVLAIPGMVICTLITALLSLTVLPWNWSIGAALMFGAIVSATDPVAVVSLLKEMCSRARLQTLIEGESLLNDGTAIVLFTLFLSLATQVQPEFKASEVIIEFVRVVAIGGIIGALVAVISLAFIGSLFNDSMIEIALTLVLPYLVFYVSEHIFHASGVVSVVTLALIYAGPGRTRFSPEVMEHLHHFWHTLSFLFNTLIFILVGLVVSTRLGLADLANWEYLAVIFLGILIIRASVILGLMPILARIGVGLTKEKSIVLIWGGLRGAVSLALALIVATNEALDIQLRDQVLFLTAGIVVLTIVVNGSSMRFVMAKLGLDKLPKAKQQTFAKVQHKISNEMVKVRGQLQKDEYLKSVNWPLVDKNIVSVGKDFVEEEKIDTQVEYLRKLLESERQFYWNQFSKGLLSQNATHILVAAIEKALDGTPQIWPRTSIIKHWMIPEWSVRCSTVPVIGTYARAASYRQHVIMFETARGLFEASEYIKELAPSLSLEPEQLEFALGQVELVNQFAKKTLIDFKEQSPHLVERVESYLALRILLNTERKMIQNLTHDGMISEVDAEKLIETVEFKMHQSKKQSL